MQNNQILQEFNEAGAILKGHFILSSGLHTDTYLQCARVMMEPKRGESLCKALAKLVRSTINTSIDIVVAPAMGGVVVGYEMGRQLDVPTIFCERVDGTFTLRRGFSLDNNPNVLLVEDVVTTGKSSRETIDCVKSFGGNVVAEASLIDRTNGKDPAIGVPLISLLTVEVETFDEDHIPAHLVDIPAIKPGSRHLSKKTA